MPTMRWRESTAGERCLISHYASTFIVGFPGETDADCAQLLEFLAAAGLDQVGCFTYSPVEGAPANAPG